MQPVQTAAFADAGEIQPAISVAAIHTTHPDPVLVQGELQEKGHGQGKFILTRQAEQVPEPAATGKL